MVKNTRGASRKRIPMDANEKLRQVEQLLADATPGPWFVDGMDSGHSKYEMNLWVTTENGDVICDMDASTRVEMNQTAKDEGWADQALIALAPTLLQKMSTALRSVLHHHMPDGNGYCISCWDFNNDMDIKYPCPTVKDVERILGE